jgi:hypothetical protein
MPSNRPARLANGEENWKVNWRRINRHRSGYANNWRRSSSKHKR